MGILEIFDSPNFLGSVLGMDSANAAPAPPPPPPAPPPSVMAGAGPGFSPTSTINSGMLNPADAAGAPGADAAPDWLKGAGPVMRGMPFSRPPQTAPTGSPVAGGAPPPVDQGDAGPGPALDVPRPGANPPAYAVPMPPRMGESPDSSISAGGLRTAIGLGDPSTARSTMAGLGAGMARVGALPSGASRGRSIATGLGGGIQGNIADRDVQRGQDRQDKNDLFTQSSTAFKDILAARQADDMSTLRSAQGKLALSRSQALMTALQTNTSSRAWMNTPEGRMQRATDAILKFRDQQRKILTENAKSKGEEVDIAQLDQATAKYAEKLYREWKIDPKQAEKSATRGQAQDNPWDTKDMTQEVFDAVVPMGAWFRDAKSGQTLQRTKPPGSSPGRDAATALENDNAIGRADPGTE